MKILHQRLALEIERWHRVIITLPGSPFQAASKPLPPFSTGSSNDYWRSITHIGKPDPATCATDHSTKRANLLFYFAPWPTRVRFDTVGPSIRPPLITVQPPIPAIHCNSLYSLANFVLNSFMLS